MSTDQGGLPAADAAQAGDALAALAANASAQAPGIIPFNLTLETNITLADLPHHQHVPDEAELRHALGVFYLVLFSMFGAQMALFMWRKRHRRTYDLATLLGLWLIPPIISFHLSFWRFLAVWVLYTGVTGYYLYACSFGKLSKHLPKQVYSWFLLVFRISTAVGVAGYLLLLAEIFGLGELLRWLLSPSAAVTAVWYGLYYGILARDSAEVASDRIASALGTGRRMAVSVRDCGVCGGELNDGPTSPTAAGPGAASAASVQLSCKHLFHPECIRGWTIVGKKDTCPTCWEKVDLRALYAERPWETRNLSWIQMLDMVRYLVVWNPIILVALHFAFHLMGLDQPPAHDLGAVPAADPGLELTAAVNTAAQGAMR